MKFVKMTALGNDFILINCFETETNFEPNRLAQLMCDRRFGVGADGIIFLEASEIADFKISTYNSEGEMVMLDGNAIRCLAKYAYDSRLTNMTTLQIETAIGTREVTLAVKGEKARLATATLGIPKLRSNGAEISIEGGKEYSRDVVVETLAIGQNSLKIVAIDLGEMHAVIFAKDLGEAPFEMVGPLVEKHVRFPEKANVIFAEKLDEAHLAARVWSKGNGEIMSSASSAAAVSVASKLLGFTGDNVDVKYPGGSMQVFISEDGNVKVTGAVTEVFSGDFT